MQYSVDILRSRQNMVRYNWGFQFALWCSILWGTFYLGIELLVHNDGFMGVPFAARDPFHTACVVAALTAVMLAVFCVIWVAISGKLTDWAKMMCSFRHENRLLLGGAVLGGMAAWLSYIVGNWVDTTFAVGMVMFYPVIGGIVAHLWYRERISRRCILGLAVVVTGCIVLYMPAFADSLGSTVVLSCFMGLLAGTGWGLEAVLATRAMDVVDSEVSVAVRYTYEALIWIVFSLVMSFMPQVMPIQAYYISVLTNPISVVLLLIITLCFSLNYFAWYKSFILCGVAKGLAISDLSGFVTVVLGMFLLTSFPSWSEVFACMIMAIGVFIVYNDVGRALTVIRDIDLTPLSRRVELARSTDRLTEKTAAMMTIAENGVLWDYEVAQMMTEGIKEHRRLHRTRNQIRTYLIESAAAGMITAVDGRIDDGDQFSKGKLLSRYALTEFGLERLRHMGFVEERR